MVASGAEMPNARRQQLLGTDFFGPFVLYSCFTHARGEANCTPVAIRFLPPMFSLLLGQIST